MKGFTFNGIHSDALGIIMTGKRVPITPPLTENFEEIPGKDGVWDYGVQYGARPIEIDCSIIGSNVADLKTKVRTLAGVMNPRLGAQTLVFDDEPDKQYLARLTGQLPLDQIGSLGNLTIQLICPDPFLYAVAESLVSGTTPVVVNNGTYYTQPTLTITHGGGAGTVQAVRSDNKTQVLTFTSSAPAGTYTVDCKAGTIIKSAVGAYKYLSGDFFLLPPGSNNITKTGGVTNIDVRFRHTWF